MRSANKAERKLGGDFDRLLDIHRLEVSKRVLRFLERIKRESRVVLRFVRLVVERSIFFLQVAGVGQNDAA